MGMDIEARVTKSLAINRYIRAMQRFEEASKDFNEACQGVRAVLDDNEKFISKHEYISYLVMSDDANNFEIEEIETL